MVYVLLADGFEEIEALTSVDVLRRAGVEVKTVGITKNTVVGAHGISVEADFSESEALSFAEKIDLLLLPGGMPGASNLNASDAVHTLIDKTIKDGGFLSAICAAPFILGERGLLKGKKSTCYPGFEEKLEGAILVNEGVVRDGNIITGRAMGSALSFALALVEALCGADKKESISASLLKE